MKNITKLTPGGLTCAVLLAACALVPSARAQFSLVYEEDFGTHHKGDAFTGAFKINLQDFDMGSLYPNLGAPGSARGYGAGGSGTQTIEGGIATLNGTQTSGATGAVAVNTTVNGVAQPATSGPEDSWGIARITFITDLDGGVVWSEAGTNSQLTVMFYGEKDFYVNQLADGFQEINGVGLHADIYYQSKSAGGYTAYDPTHGSSYRTAEDGYTTVTDGNLILSTVSTPGFLHPDGALGGSDAEFSSNFNQTSGGTGQTYLSVTGGSSADAFDTNGFDAVFKDGITADLFAQFTTKPNFGSSNWLVSSNDPVSGAFVAVPEPSTYGLAGAALLSAFVAVRRRKQKLVSA